MCGALLLGLCNAVTRRDRRRCEVNVPPISSEDLQLLQAKQCRAVHCRLSPIFCVCTHMSWWHQHSLLQCGVCTGRHHPMHGCPQHNHCTLHRLTCRSSTAECNILTYIHLRLSIRYAGEEDGCQRCLQCTLLTVVSMTWSHDQAEEACQDGDSRAPGRTYVKSFEHGQGLGYRASL